MQSQIEPIKRTTMTAKEAACYLGLSVEMIYILCREKRISHFKVGSRILFKRDAIDKWIESQMISGIGDE